MNKTQSLESITSSRRTLLGAIDGLSRSELSQPDLVDDLSIQDVLGHITAWDQACLTPLRSFLKGEDFIPEYYENQDDWNRIQVERKRKLTTDIILNDLVIIREELLAALAKLPDDRWSVEVISPWQEKMTIAEMVSGLADHELEHARAIQVAFRKFYEEGRAGDGSERT